MLTEQDRFLYLVDSVEHRQESRSENLGWFRREKVQDGTSEEPGEQQSPVNCQMTKDPKEPLEDNQQCERENKKVSIEVIIYLEVITCVACKTTLKLRHH